MCNKGFQQFFQALVLKEEEKKRQVHLANRKLYMEVILPNEDDFDLF